MLHRRAAAEQERLGAQAIANCRQPVSVCFRMCKAAVVRRADGRPVQEIDLQVVVAPFPHDSARKVVQPLLDTRVRAVERENPAAPWRSGVDEHG